MTDVLQERLQRTAVVGANGRMGRGIALLLLQQLMLTRIPFTLFCIDLNRDGFPELRGYLREHLLRYAEKNIVRVREFFRFNEEIVSNLEAIEHLVESMLDRVHCSTAIEQGLDADIVFEAAFEDIAVKTAILKKCAQHPSLWVLSNTSSIPIHLLAKESGLNERLIGYHFYNPPTVQKLMEIIPSRFTSQELKEYAVSLAEQLQKSVVFSADIAGFIGNGHFAREILFACKEAERFVQEGQSPKEAIAFIDLVTKEKLVRPMGIFELVRYVGFQVAENLLHIMQEQLPDPSFKTSFIKKLKETEYQPPESEAWKKASKEKIDFSGYFRKLKESGLKDDRFAIHFLEHSKKIEERLVQDKVAASLDDVGTVIKLGFHHLYAPHEVI